MALLQSAAQEQYLIRLCSTNNDPEDSKKQSKNLT